MQSWAPKHPQQIDKSTMPSLTFTPLEWERLQVRLRLSPIEVSGFGRIRRRNGLFLVDQSILPIQAGDAGSTEIDELTVANFVETLMHRDENPAEWRLWWHSHANMGVFWSATDDHAIEELLLSTPYLFSLVGNRAGETRVRLDIATPRICLDNLSIRVDYGSSELWPECHEEFESNVTKLVLPPARVLKKARKGKQGAAGFHEHLPHEDDEFDFQEESCGDEFNEHS